MSISKIFEEIPKQWRLSGDPQLWSALERWLSNKELPSTTEDLSNLLEIAFEDITGQSVFSQEESVYIDNFDTGGMSGGHVSFAFWREIGFPLLVNNYAKWINNISE